MTAYVWSTSARDYRHGPLDVAAAARDGISAITAGCSEGRRFYADRYFGATVAAARSAGLPLLGAYHVLHPGTVADQVDWFLSLVSEQAPWWKSHPGWFWEIDAQKFSYTARAPNMAEIKGFADLLCRRAGVPASRVLVHAPRWLYGDSLAGLRYRLWASNHGSNPATHFPAGYPGDNSDRWAAYSGQSPLLLRYGSALRVGTQNSCDVSGFRGSPAQLFAAITGAAAATGGGVVADTPLQLEIKNLTVSAPKPPGMGGPAAGIRFADYLGWTANAIGAIAAQVATVTTVTGPSRPVVDQAALTEALVAAMNVALPAAVQAALVAAFNDPAVLRALAAATASSAVPAAPEAVPSVPLGVPDTVPAAPEIVPLEPSAPDAEPSAPAAEPSVPDRPPESGVGPR